MNLNRLISTAMLFICGTFVVTSCSGNRTRVATNAPLATPGARPPTWKPFIFGYVHDDSLEKLFALAHSIIEQANDLEPTIREVERDAADAKKSQAREAKRRTKEQKRA